MLVSGELLFHCAGSEAQARACSGAEARAEGLGSEPDCPAFVTLGKRLNLSEPHFRL